ncbi:MAG: 3-hydroxyacyl-CoA dehydrogenase family protein [Bacteroidota bacterium]|jgi:3-hydroxybutyryl-CoA dehydrogenase
MIIGICGAGTMGRGIAIASLTSGHSVVLCDLSEQALESARTSIAEQLRKAVDKGKLSEESYASAVSSMSTSTELPSLASANIVIEAIAERVDIKHALFCELEKIVSASAILATNTSSISIASLARVLVDPSRFVGLHFFNPAHIMKLVEVIKGPRTSQSVVETCVAFAKGLGKTPVVAADAPGFIVNRIARNYYNESQRIVMEGAASIAQVDELMKGIGFKMGPFELMDLIGVDVNLDVTKSQWTQFFQEPRFTPSLLQQQYVDAGLHGKKSGGGFTV